MLRIPLQHRFVPEFFKPSLARRTHLSTCNVVLANDTAVIGTTREGFGRGTEEFE